MKRISRTSKQVSRTKRRNNFSRTKTKKNFFKGNNNKELFKSRNGKKCFRTETTFKSENSYKLFHFANFLRAKTTTEISEVQSRNNFLRAKTTNNFFGSKKNKYKQQHKFSAHKHQTTIQEQNDKQLQN